MALTPVSLFRSLRWASFAAVALASLSAHGNTPDADAFGVRYPAYFTAQPDAGFTGRVGCGSCHTSGTALNLYGAAYKVAGRANPTASFISIEPGDADGDGYTNVSELTNGNGAYRAYDATVHPTAAAASSASPATKPGLAGSTVSYTVTVTNNGNIPDSFTLGVSVLSGQSWVPTITGTANNVPAGGAANVTVNVAVAGGATQGLSSVARFTATSQANATISATPLDLTTTAAAATTTALSSSLNPSVGGQSVTFTATVTSGGAGAITGSITFLDGASTMCNAVAVASAQAQCTLSTVPPGTHSITAQYSGSTIYVGSTSAPLSQVVNAVFKYVNAATGVNTGNCSSQANPCKTITYAMAQATAGNPGDQISVAPGTYNLALGEAFPITFKSGIQLVATGTPANTIIDAAGDTVKQGIFFSSATNGRLEGFTITNGLAISSAANNSLAQGGAMRIFSASGAFTVTRNVFSNNEARGFAGDGVNRDNGGSALGGALYVSFSPAVNVTNNVFTGNIARGGNGFSHPSTALTLSETGGTGVGGAIYFDTVGGAATNNTFSGNSAIGGNGGTASNGTANGGAAQSGAAKGNPTFTIVNNIFANNSATSGTGGTPGTATAGAAGQASASSSNNLSFGNTVNGGASAGDSIGTGSVTQDPLFHSPPSNLHIRLASPAKSAGTPAGAPIIDFDATVRPSPPSIGAFEATGVTSTTALVSSLNPSAVGQSVTFTATVSGIAGTPTGTATFKDATTVICAATTLVSGQAACTLSSLAQGTRSITAEYPGDATYAASISSAVSQVVNGASSFTLTITKTGAGTGTVTSSPAGINCGATCAGSFTSGSAVTLTAVPGGSSTFTGWTGGGCTGTGGCTVTMNAATTVTATFGATANFGLTVSKTGSGTGTVTSSPAGISCGATCSANFNTGPVVTLSAAAAAGSTFGGWSGGGCSGTGVCTVTMTGVTGVTATFTATPPGSFPLTVAQAGSGSGTVTSSPAGISCGATCVANFTSGTSVTLSATAASGSTFTGWSGGSCSGTGGCTVTMSAATTVTATFTATTGQLVTRYRLYSSGTFEHLYTTDLNEYNVLPVCCAWIPEGAIYKIFSGPGSYGGVTAVAYFRLYNPFSHQHHWTTDPNEYAVLASFGWVQEGTDGYILPTGAAGTLPLYRLYLNAAGGLHLWTTDANERNVLTASQGWINEGIAGYVIPLP